MEKGLQKQISGKRREINNLIAKNFKDPYISLQDARVLIGK